MAHPFIFYPLSYTCLRTKDGPVRVVIDIVVIVVVSIHSFPVLAIGRPPTITSYHSLDLPVIVGLSPGVVAILTDCFITGVGG